MAQQEYDRLGQGLEYEQYLSQLGAYQACVRHLTLIDTLIEKADQHHERTRAKSDDSHARAIFFGSPYQPPR